MASISLGRKSFRWQFSANSPRTISARSTTVIGMCREEWHARCRELGLGVTRSATLTEVRHKLEKKGLVKHVGWTYVASRMPTGRSFCTRFVCTECGLLGAYIPPD